MVLRALRVSAVVVLTLSLVACGGEPPAKEILQAQSAIDAARAAGAVQYAADEFAAATAALQNANAAVEQRDYRLALNHALDSLERAGTAAAQAASAEAEAKTTAAAALASATAALDAAAARIKAADAAQLPPRILAGPRARFADAEARLQEARTTWNGRDYATATAAATAAAEISRGITSALATAPASPARRPR